MGLFDRFRLKHTENSKHEMHNELLKYIQQRKFALVLKFLLADQDYGRETIRSFASSDHGNFLHLLLRYQPPQELVALAVHLMVDSDELVPEDTRDASGATPLHVAVQHNCDASIVQLLVEGMAGTLPAVTKDEMLRYPLHWACANPSGSVAKLNKQQQQHHAGANQGDMLNMLRIITILSKIEPMSVNVKDVNGQTPLDLALEHGADERIMQLLHKASTKARSCVYQAHDENDDDNDEHDVTHHHHGYPPSIQCSQSKDDDISSVSWQEMAKNDESAIMEWERTFKKDCGLLDDDDEESDNDDDEDLSSSSDRSGCAVNLTTPP
ncbi:hypothetical protein MPSEU_000224300 [Mayamaea pseudoterrestris]|nr:hypothetical protein MPSEU_000224300 [Mayamaea pseudoterrestris]